MGYSGLVRWTNAPTTGLELIAQNIIKNHQGQYKGRWILHMKSFRSTMGSVPGFQVPVERSMCTLTMDDNVFCVIEDPAAPMRADYLQHAAEYARTNPGMTLQPPTHYRQTFPTLSPPMALEQLLTQLRARWVSVRQTGSSASNAGTSGQKGVGMGTGPHLTVDGHVYSIGTDWLVRAGNVHLAGGAVKGMLLEVEYLPLPVMEATLDMQPVLAGLLLSVLPNVPDPKLAAITLAEWQWEEVQWDSEEDLEREAEKRKKDEDEEDIYASEGDHPPVRKGDWIGMDRDRRSAYLIIGALKQENLL
ncbi:hypothetical protein BD311DRAFT_860781 [Dichomitus squalens]|uniref:Mediator complex subunit 20 n=1 Tax=Dichomitus squalens TaxID=114155 RepID=A0A4Q9QBJ5_9APHY|nr:hypothetical protein BD311DRAFT_860781 [Dichomitus squalens]TBU65077.1 hypothetical protein BD310DRAFT_838858 [Dichomitus squalens]